MRKILKKGKVKHSRNWWISAGWIVWSSHRELRKVCSTHSAHIAHDRFFLYVWVKYHNVNGCVWWYAHFAIGCVHNHTKTSCKRLKFDWNCVCVRASVFKSEKRIFEQPMPTEFWVCLDGQVQVSGGTHANTVHDYFIFDLIIWAQPHLKITIIMMVIKTNDI